MIGLYSTTENPELKQACSDFLDSKDRAMLGLSMAPKKGELYTGLTIWVPLQGDSDGVSRYYDKLQFHKEAYHKGSCDIVPQAPFFVKPGTFDGFSTGNRLLPTG